MLEGLTRQAAEGLISFRNGTFSVNPDGADKSDQPAATGHRFEVLLLKMVVSFPLILAAAAWVLSFAALDFAINLVIMVCRLIAFLSVGCCVEISVSPLFFRSSLEIFDLTLALLMASAYNFCGERIELGQLTGTCVSKHS